MKGIRLCLLKFMKIHNIAPSRETSKAGRLELQRLNERWKPKVGRPKYSVTAGNSVDNPVLEQIKRLNSP